MDKESLEVCELENALSKLPLARVSLARVCWVAWRIEGLDSGSGPSKGGGGNAARDTVRVE